MVQPYKKKSASPTASSGKGKQRNEKLIRGSIHGELVGTTWVDEKANISEILVDTVTFKANCMESFFHKPNGTEASYYGQVGFIRQELLSATPDGEPASKRRRNDDRQPFPQASCWSSLPVTALHNISDESFAETYASSKVFTSTRPSATLPLEFPEGGRMLTQEDEFVLMEATEQDTTIYWESLDKTMGTPIVNPANFLAKKPMLFEKVPDGGFEIEEGQLIGMAVYRTFEIFPEDANATEGTDMEHIYGPAGTTCIYTGKITKIHRGKLSFEHSINTFCGCSGATIFLLDNSQVPSAAAFAGKALAVHVGGHPNDSTRANVAFVI